MDEFNVWKAGMTKRWHANADLCSFDDPVSSHTHRMSILAYHFWGYEGVSKKLAYAITIHDLGEIGVGDLAYPAKKAYPEFGEMAKKLEGFVLNSMGFSGVDLIVEDERRLHFLDRLDAILFGLYCKPNLINTNGWAQGVVNLNEEAKHLGCLDKVEALFNG